MKKKPRRPGVFEKVNPKATPLSVVRHAILVGVVTAALLAILSYFGKLNPSYPFGFWIAFVIGSALLGALGEWQVPDDEDDEYC